LIEASVVFAYLAVVLYIGIFAFRKAKGTSEDYFLASRSIGTLVFLLSLFGTNMTSFTILGASGKAYQDGIGVYGLMASSSGLIIPLTIFLVGTRIWSAGKRFGHMTPVQLFRDRWEAGHIGTAIFVIQAGLLVPYVIIGIMGGGTTLSTISGGVVPEWLGGAVVALVVMSYVFFGGMRGTAWVNSFQTLLFLGFGLIAFVVISQGMGGLGAAVERLLDAPPEGQTHLLTRERMPLRYFFSYTFIPLSAIAFPHICIFCLTAKRLESFKRTVVLYPICIMAIWLPSVFLGTLAAGDPAIRSQVTTPDAVDEVMLLLLRQYAPHWLAGVLGAGIMAAVMASDSQILALSTMFTEDVFGYYGGRERFGERVQVMTGRLFVVAVTVVAFAIAMATTQKIFDLAIKYAFTGYAALSPLVVAALFWRRSTKWGALASVLVVSAGLVATACIEEAYPPPVPPAQPYPIGPLGLLTRTPGGVSIQGFLPVVPLVILSGLAMTVASLLTRPPSRDTVERYFPTTRAPHPVRSGG
jgi:SSS family solute:Na+ symporter